MNIMNVSSSNSQVLQFGFCIQSKFDTVECYLRNLHCSSLGTISNYWAGPTSNLSKLLLHVLRARKHVQV
jgi:hypothetical protein